MTGGGDQHSSVWCVSVVRLADIVGGVAHVDAHLQQTQTHTYIGNAAVESIVSVEGSHLQVTGA